jgi:signal transduction histidine kinase
MCIRLLVLQTAAALVINVLRNELINGALLIVVAGAVPLVVSSGVAAAWVLFNSVTLALILAIKTGSAVAITAFIGFQMFALGISHLAESEARARRDLRRVNAELLATRRQLADNIRTGERLRISRDLHDVLAACGASEPRTCDL